MPASPKADNLAAKCLTAEQIEAFLGDALSVNAAQSVAEHLEGCADCVAALEQRTSLDHCAELDDAKRGMVARLSTGRGSPISTRLKRCGLVGGEEPDGQTETLIHAASSTDGHSQLQDDRLRAIALEDIPKLDGYDIVRPLGSGGMGHVFLARQHSLQRDVAVKFLAIHPSSESRRRFRREAEAVGRLDHENVVRAYDAGEVDGQPYLVMQLLQGRDLAEQLKQDGPLSIPVACRIVAEAARGLQAAHDDGLVHRDVKPGNLMMTDEGCLKVLDLGLVSVESTASNIASLTPANQPLTMVGSIMGSTDYIAPEQAADVQAADARSDIYSLGCTLYTLLAGHPPFHEFRQPAKKLIAHAQHERPDVRNVCPDVGKDLSQYIQRMMSTIPDQRPESMLQVAESLAELGNAGSGAGRGRLALLAAGGAGIAALLSIIVITFRDGSKMTIETDKPVASLKLAEGEEIAEISVDGQPHSRVVAPEKSFKGLLATLPQNQVVGFGFGATNRDAYVVFYDGRIIHWQPDNEEKPSSVVRPRDAGVRIGPIAMHVSDQHALLFGSSNGLSLLDLESNRPLWTVDSTSNIHAKRVPNTDLFIHSRHRTTYVRSLKDGHELAGIRVRADSPPDVGPDGRHLVLVDRQTRSVHLYDLENQRVAASRRSFAAEQFEATDVAFSADGKHIIAIGGPKWVVWDIKSGELAFRQRTKSSVPHDHLHRIGQSGWYVSIHGQLRDRLKVWDPMTGKVWREIVIPATHKMVVSDDGRHALTTDFDHNRGYFGKNLRLWTLGELENTMPHPEP